MYIKNYIFLEMLYSLHYLEVNNFKYMFASIFIKILIIIYNINHNITPIGNIIK